MARQLVIDIVGDSKKFTKATDEAGVAASNLGSKFDKLKSFALPAAAGVAAVGAVLVSATKAAAEDAAEQAKLQLALKNTVGATDEVVASVEKQIEKFTKVSTLTDTELRTGYQNLVTATKDVKLSTDLMTTAMDIAAAKGIPLETVTMAISKAYLGNEGALGKLGIAVKDTEGKTKSFTAIMDEANKTFGGQAAKAADTTEGKMARLRNTFDELKEKIGEKLLPVLEDLSEWALEDGVPAVEKFIDSMDDLGDKVAVVIDGVKDAWHIINTLDRGIARVADILLPAWATDSLPKHHRGGVVAGTPGTEVPIMALAGETVLPIGASGGTGSVVININGSVVTERQLIDVVHDGLLNKQRRSGALGFDRF